MTDRFALMGAGLAAPVIGLSFALFGGFEAWLSCALGLAMLAIALSDLRDFIIPDWLSLPAIPLGLLAASLSAMNADPDLAVLEHTLAALVAGLAFYALAAGYRWLRGQDGLGLGDVKLAAAAGAWTGPEGAALVVILACLGAFVFTAWLRLAAGRELGHQTMLPFGAFLAPAIWLVWSAQQYAGAG